jgi:hypothetical protein
MFRNTYPMLACTGKIFINKIAQSPSSKANTPIIGPTKCPKPPKIEIKKRRGKEGRE